MNRSPLWGADDYPVFRMRAVAGRSSAAVGVRVVEEMASEEAPSGVVEVPTAVGNGTQRIFLLRAQQTVVTVLAGRYNDFTTNPPERLLLDFILPALPPAAASRCPS